MITFRDTVYKNLRTILNGKYGSLSVLDKKSPDYDSDEILRDHVSIIVRDLMTNMPSFTMVPLRYETEEWQFLEEMRLLFIKMDKKAHFVNIPMNNETFYTHLLRIFDDLNYLLNPSS
jgi:hypothetical protein